MSFFSSRDNLQTLNSLAKSETLLGESLRPGQSCSTFHFQIHSSLGWITWKDREAALYMYVFLSNNYRLFERAFAATRCELKISDSLDEFACEVEIPNDQEVSICR